MHILILGAAGMVGRKLTERLLRDGQLGGKDISKMTLQDVVAPAKPAAAKIPIEIVTSDFADANTAAPLVGSKPEVIFHLAAIVSGEAEAEFDKGYRINLDGTRFLIDAIRAIGGGYKPRLVFTSSIAVFGAPFPEKIGDEFFHTPLTSYGTQKTICELLIADYTRKGLLDGVGIRLPTICVRPGTPNKAASGFSPILFANRWQVMTPSCRCRTTCGTGTHRRALPWAFSFMPQRWTQRRWGRDATCRCPDCPSPSVSRSPRWSAWLEKASPLGSSASRIPSSTASLPAGRAISSPIGRCHWASQRRKTPSTTSYGFTSRMNWAGSL